jgi:hypothetical protein
VNSHVHDSFRCPEHVYGCECLNLDEWLCNPYWVRGHCPDGLLVMPDDLRRAGMLQPATFDDDGDSARRVQAVPVDEAEDEW